MVHTGLGTLQILANCGTKIRDSKKCGSLINSCAERGLVCNVKSCGRGREGAIGLRSVGDAATYEGFSDRKIVDGGSMYVHVFRQRGGVGVDSTILVILLVGINVFVVRRGCLLVASLDVGGDIEMKALVGPIQVAGNLLVVVLVVTKSSGDFDLLDVGMFGCVSGPLHHGS